MMNLSLSRILRFGQVATILNEIRGIVVGAPMLYALWLSTDSLFMKVWISISMVLGLALSVIIPNAIIKRVKEKSNA